jgi:hypothetical protein
LDRASAAAPIREFNTYPFPQHVETSSSFYSNSSAAQIVQTIEKTLDSLSVDYLSYPGEAKLTALIHKSHSEPVIFSIKVFNNTENNSFGHFLVEVQRRSGPISAFSQFYSQFYCELQRASIISRSFSGVAQPTVLQGLEPPHEGAQNASFSPSQDFLALLLDLSRAEKLSTAAEALELLGNLESKALKGAAQPLITSILANLQRRSPIVQQNSLDLLQKIVENCENYGEILLLQQNSGLFPSFIEILRRNYSESGGSSGDLLLERANKRKIAQLLLFFLQNNKNFLISVVNSNLKEYNLAGELQRAKESEDKQLNESIDKILQAIN